MTLLPIACDWHELMSHPNFKLVFMFGTGSLIAIIAIMSSTIRTIIVSRAKEQTKRELAAYVAEGSLKPEQAVAMINAGRPHWETGRGHDHSGGGGKGGCCA